LDLLYVALHDLKRLDKGHHYGVDMKRPIMILAAIIGLAGCERFPSPEKVAADAKVGLQAQLDREYTRTLPVVQKVEVVKLTAPKYDGSATITANDTTFTVPVAITSDGKTTILAVDDQS
jgi:hypothetical protein